MNIKIRAWDLDNQQMYYISEDIEDEDCERMWCIDYDDGRIVFQEPCQVDKCPGGMGHEQYDIMRAPNQVTMLWSGLKDKNGKEIYEGDVIGRKGFFNRVIEHNGVNFQSYLLNNSSMKWVLAKESIDECDEIIGNIFQHPELLEEK